MKRSFFFLVFLFFSVQLIAQDLPDSLLMVWQNDEQSDSIRIEALTEYLLNYFAKKEPDSTAIYTQKLEDFSRAKGLRYGISNAYRALAVSKYYQHKYSEAIGVCKKALAIAEEESYLIGEAKILRLMGSVYQLQSQQAKSLQFFEKSLTIFKTLKDTTNYSNVLMDIGSIHKQTRNYDLAIEYNEQAYNWIKNQGDTLNISNALASLASIYRRKNEYQKALDLNNEALNYRLKLGEEMHVASSYNNIGNIHEDLEDYEKALEYHFKALKIRQANGRAYSIASSSKNIGDTYHVLNRNKESVQYCKKSYDLYRATNSSKPRLHAACECLYAAYKSLGDSEMTLKFLEEKIALEEEMNFEENVKKIQEMEFEKQILEDSIAQEVEKQRINEVYKLAIEEEEQIRNTALVASLCGLLLAVGFYIRWRVLNTAKKEIQQERDRAEALLLNILPAEIAQELKETGKVEAMNFTQASVLFTDFQGFTEISEQLSAKDLVEELNECFKIFDNITTKYGLEKIKTIGDAYMVAAGLPAPSISATKNIVLAALEMSAFIIERHQMHQEEGKIAFRMRAGIHTGPLVAGIVGVKKFQYDVWGDTVNIASRMESSSEVGKVNISEATYQILKADEDFVFEERGMIQAKGKGAIAMYFIEKKNR